MPRAVPEWIGKTPDTPVPERVQLRVLRAYDYRCYLTGKEIVPGDDWEIEHKHALILGGENRESNLAPALTEPHKRKTAVEMKVKAKIDRLAKKHRGIKKPSRFPGSKDSRFKKLITGEVVDRRTGEIL
jgi:5-methylcytosine-specific restriction enzyme A